MPLIRKIMPAIPIKIGFVSSDEGSVYQQMMDLP